MQRADDAVEETQVELDVVARSRYPHAPSGREPRIWRVAATVTHAAPNFEVG